MVDTWKVKQPAAPVAPAAPQPPNLVLIGANSVDAARAAELAKQMNAITFQKRLPGSTLEGLSRVLSGAVGGYYEGQKTAKEKAQREAIVNVLGGIEGVTDLQKALVATGDPLGIKSVLGTQYENRAAKRARELAVFKAKLAERLALIKAGKKKGFQVVKLKDKFGNERPYRLEKQNGRLVPVPVDGTEVALGATTAPAPAPTAPEGAPVSSVPGITTEPPFGSLPEAPLNSEAYAKKQSQELAKFKFKNAAEKNRVRAQFSAAVEGWQTALNNLDKAAKIVAPSKSKALERILPETATGTLGKILQYWPESDRNTLLGLLAPLKSMIAFDRLHRMRTQESTTGGALGQVSNKEIQMLQDSITSFSLDRKASDVRQSLAELKKHLQMLIRRGKEDLDRFGIDPVKAGAEPAPKKKGVLTYNRDTGQIE